MAAVAAADADTASAEKGRRRQPRATSSRTTLDIVQSPSNTLRLHQPARQCRHIVISSSSSYAALIVFTSHRGATSKQATPLRFFSAHPSVVRTCSRPLGRVGPLDHDHMIEAAASEGAAMPPSAPANGQGTSASVDPSEALSQCLLSQYKYWYVHEGDADFWFNKIVN